jgi:hypothetical protein
VKMIDCKEGVQCVCLGIPGEPGVEGFARHLVLVVTDGNQVLTHMFMTSIGKHRSLDGTDAPRRNHGGCWCRIVVRISDRPESFVEKGAALDWVAAVSCCFCHMHLSVIVKQPMSFVCLFFMIVTVIEHA